MNKSKVGEAVACLVNDDFNCSQAIFSTYCEELGLDKTAALKMACGLGAGMGRLQGTCGALSGAYLLIGLKYGKFIKGDDQAKEKTYDLVRECTRLFTARNKATSCRELIGVDLLTGDKQVASERFKTVCPKLVRDAAEIVELILSGKQS